MGTAIGFILGYSAGLAVFVGTFLLRENRLRVRRREAVLEALARGNG